MHTTPHTTPPASHGDDDDDDAEGDDETGVLNVDTCSSNDERDADDDSSRPARDKYNANKIGHDRSSHDNDDDDDDDDNVYSTTLPWRVCDAFTYGMTCVLHYAGSALPPRELLTLRTILQLAVVDNNNNDESNNNNDDSMCTGKCSVQLDAAELLLRLALRKPSAYTLAGLLRHYSAWLRVHDALARLACTRIDDDDHTTTTATTTTMTTMTTMSRQASHDGCAVQRWCGAVVADALLQLTSIADDDTTVDNNNNNNNNNESNNNNDNNNNSQDSVDDDSDDDDESDAEARRPRHDDDDTTTTTTTATSATRAYAQLARVLAAVRVAELRQFAVALYQYYAMHCTPPAATTTTTTTTTSCSCLSADDIASRTVSPVPTRKGDVVRYVLLRRYHPAASSSSLSSSSLSRCDCDVVVERVLLTRYWDTLVGDVYTLHARVQRHVRRLAELLHALTDTLDEYWATTSGSSSSIPLSLLRGDGDCVRTRATPTTTTMKPTTCTTLQLPALLLPSSPASSPSSASSSSASASAFCSGADASAMATRRAAAAATTATTADTNAAAAAATNAHTATTLLFTRDQFAMLRHVHRCHSSNDNNNNDNACACCAALPHICLFPDAASLATWRAGVRVQRALRALVDTPRFVVHHAQPRLLRLYRATLHAIAQSPPSHAASPPRYVTVPHIASNSNNNNNGSGEEKHCDNDATVTMPTLWWLLRTHGLRVQHLLRYTPRYSWFACLDLLHDLLQSARCYREANVCLRLLLDEPLLLLRADDGDDDACAEQRRHNNNNNNNVAPTVSLALHYRVDKRGKWQHRLAQNLMHLRQKAQALQLLEDVHASWPRAVDTDERNKNNNKSDDDGHGAMASSRPGELLLSSDARAAMRDVRARCRLCACALCRRDRVVVAASFAQPRCTDDGDARVDEAAVRALVSRLPASLQRRVRLLRALWPSTARDHYSNSDSSHNNNKDDATTRADRYACAVYHAVAEYTHARYCRRHDRLRIECTLRTLHAQLRRWTPLSRRVCAFSDALARVPTMTVRGVRDVHARTLWHAASRRHRSVAAPVEAFVLQHLLRTFAATAAADSDNDDDDDDSEDATVSSSLLLPPPPPRRGAVLRCGAWCGVHCEGAWLAQLSRLLLLSSSSPPQTQPSTRDGDGAAVAAADDGDDDSAAVCNSAEGEWLWLTPLQPAPLDRHTPLDYVERRRAWLTRRLATLETATRDEVMALAAQQLGDDNDGDDGLPVLSMLRAMPRHAALWALLRRLLLSDPFDGYTPRFSGFPDLVLWRDDDGDGETQAATRVRRTRASSSSFVLVEVKSPTDELSSRQRAVNDCLRTCGFDVRVAHVIEAAAAATAASPHGKRARDAS